ncbi:MAG: porin family protein [Dysgonomonas sp.]|nr:porin family protein [Dysgonomonas sp.]
MKTTFKLFTILAFFSLSMISAQAQHYKLHQYERKVDFVIKAGINLSDLTGFHHSTNMKLGYNVGLNINYNLSPKVYLYSGLELLNKGANYTYTEEWTEYDMTIKDSRMNMIYLQIPLHAGYKIKLNEKNRLSFHAGPYMAFGIGGKRTFGDKVTKKYHHQESAETITLEQYRATVKGFKKHKDIFSDELMKGFDLGIGIGVRFEHNCFSYGLNYDHGLMDVSRGGNNEKNSHGTLITGPYDRVKNRTGYLSVGYRF